MAPHLRGIPYHTNSEIYAWRIPITIPLFLGDTVLPGYPEHFESGSDEASFSRFSGTFTARLTVHVK